MSTAAVMPRVGDVLARDDDEWLVVEVLESIEGKYAFTLEPMERAIDARGDGDLRDQLE